MVSWAILSCGAKVLLSMTLGNKESYEDWLSHFRDMVSWGLKPPLTVTGDGAFWPHQGGGGHMSRRRRGYAAGCTR